MPDMKEHIAYLSQEVGPRPAGTEEEQQAALYITEQFQKDAGLPAAIEDFSGVGDPDLPRMICGGAAAVFALLSLIVPVLGIVGVLVSLAAAVLLICEELDKPILSKLMGRGVSQNVVAKYDPGASGEGSASRRRKVIIVARYDSGKVRQELQGPLPQMLPLVIKASIGATAALPVLLLIRCVALRNAEGFLPVLFSVLTVVALILAVVPCVIGALHKAAPYNEGANNNASGVAAVLELARRVGAGRVSEAELAEREDAIMHGEAAAWENDLIPEGAEFVYSGGSDALRDSSGDLATAKAAIAALSGKPVSGMSAEEVERNLEKLEAQNRAAQEQEMRSREVEQMAIEQMRADAQYSDEAVAYSEEEYAEAQEIPVEPAEPASFAVDSQSEPSYEPVVESVEPAVSSPSVPAWFVKAQAKAKKNAAEEKPVQRSRYASALDAAVEESAGHFAQANNIVEKELEQTVDAGREVIHEVKAPQWATIKPVQQDNHADAASEGVPAPQSEAAQTISAEENRAKTGWGTGAQAVIDPMRAVQAQTAEQPAENDAKSAQTAAPEAAATSATEPAAPAPAQVSPAVGNIPEQFADPFATVATSPIDVAKLDLGEVPPMGDVPMPSFLNPRKVQEETLAKQTDTERSSNRVNVTDAGIASNGVVETAGLETLPQQSHEPATAQADPFALAPAVQADRAAQEAPAATIPPMPAAASLNPVTLPEIGVAAAKPAPVAGLSKQRAPLADVESAGKTAAKSLLNMLPTIGSSDIESESDDGDDKNGAKNVKANLLASLPSLSGAIKAADSVENPSVSGPIAFAGTPGATGAFAPVTEDLVKEMSSEVDPDDLYVDDADDSDYDEHFTESGAFAGPGYMEMPKSRFRRFLDRFRHTDDVEEDTPQEWLDVDDQFEARAVGKARGGWESFQNENYVEDGYADSDYPTEDDYRSAGATYGQSEAVDGATQAFAPYDASSIDAATLGASQGATQADPAGVGQAMPQAGVNAQPNRQWYGGAFSTRRMEQSNLDSEAISEEAAEAAAATVAQEVDDELNQIYQFRNPDIKTEVWFVALGSDLVQNAGMKAFVEAHASELRGAFIVEVDALGAGELSIIEHEGTLKPSRTSSRMKRYMRKASQASGVKLGNASILWEESAASYATKHGLQAMHLVGMKDGKPAYLGQQDDVAENIEDGKLESNLRFLMELLKNI